MSWMMLSLYLTAAVDAAVDMDVFVYLGGPLDVANNKQQDLQKDRTAMPPHEVKIALVLRWGERDARFSTNTHELP